MLKALTSRLTMKQGASLFMDKVAGQPVYQWTDKFGDNWLAASRWGTRIKKIN